MGVESEALAGGELPYSVALVAGLLGGFGDNATFGKGSQVVAEGVRGQV